jgi:hypothetical protein
MTSLRPNNAGRHVCNAAWLALSVIVEEMDKQDLKEVRRASSLDAERGKPAE